MACGGLGCCGFAGAVTRGGLPVFWVWGRRLWVVICEFSGGFDLLLAWF